MRFVTDVKATDRGLAYGDGFFTTAKILSGRVEHWDLHIDRLLECASRLGFPVIDVGVLRTEVLNAIVGCSVGTLKVIITRGTGGRGYEPPAAPDLTVSIQILPFPPHYDALFEQGISLGISSIRLACQPLLAGLKTLNRLEQVLIKQELTTLAYDDVVVLDLDDKVIETSVGNLLLCRQGKWVTPSLTSCGIKGVKLKSIQSKLVIEECDITLEDMVSSDAVFVCNSLMNIIPVTRLLEKSWDLESSHQLATAAGLYD